MSAFYHLKADYNRSFVDYGEGNDWEGIVCSRDPGHQRAGARTTVLKLKITRRRIVDFSSTILADLVITDRAYECLRRCEFSGFKVKPTEIVGAISGVEQTIAAGYGSWW